MRNTRRIAENEDKEDRHLVNRIASDGDKAAMEQLYNRYQARIAGFLYRTLASQDDIAEIYNETMLVVWRNALKYHGGSRVSTWIFSIAYRLCNNWIRSNSRFLHLDDTSDEVIDLSPAIDLQLSQLEYHQMLQNAIKTLSFDQRVALELAYFSGHSYTEIGEITDVSENTVKTRIFYAKRKLKSILKTQEISGDCQNEK